MAVAASDGLAQPAATLAEARTALKAGRPERALALLSDASTADGLGLKAQAAVHAGQVDLAINAYAARLALAPAHDPEILNAIAEAYLTRYAPADPRQAAVARCGREVTRAAEPDAPRRTSRASSCASEMQAIAGDGSAPPALRGAAALVLVRGGDAKAASLITGLAVTPVAAERRALLPVLQRAPASVAVPLLMAMLDDDDYGIQGAAAAAMAAFPTDDAKLALKGYLSINFRRIARAPTVISLASMGDAEALRELRRLLPELSGMDLVNGAAALADINDPRGVDALVRVTTSENDMLRAAAGATLVTRKPDVARAAFERGMGHAAGGVRLLTLDAFATTPLVDETRLVALLRDRDPQVRIRAAELLWRRTSRR